MDRLALASQSLWEIVREQTGLTAEDLQKKILEVDLRDGNADGTAEPSPQCYLELAEVLTAMGEHKASAKIYRQGLQASFKTED